MLLQFITDAAIGPKERRLIRSHVMKGKNAGRTRLGRGRQRKSSTKLCEETAVLVSARIGEQSEKISTGEIGCHNTLNQKRLLWNDLALTSFALPISPNFRHVIYHGLWSLSKVLYPHKFCTPLNFSQYVWFHYILSDSAYFHTFLAVACSFNHAFCGAPKVSPSAIHHISSAYALINPRLSESDACSDEAIAVVTILAIYHLMHHQLGIGFIHFHGLRRMVELRGGLGRLMRENRCLAQKPWRLALEFALQDGSRPIYGLYDIPTGLDLLLQDSSVDTSSYLSLSPPLLALLLDVTMITRALNDTGATGKLEPMDYSDIVCVPLHRLLHFAPLSHQRPVDPIDALVHLSLVAIMTSLMPEYGHNQAQYDLLSALLRHALQHYAAISGRDEKLLLWAVFVGYATVLDDSDVDWMVPLVLKACQRLDLRGWTEICRMLCGYAWICVLYDKSGEKLWNHIVSALG